MNGVNWVEKIIDWSWALLVGLAVAGIGLIHRVIRHEARLAQLERERDERAQASERERVERAQAMTDMEDRIEKKIDQNYERLKDLIATVDRNSREDNRLLLSKMIDKVPTA